MLIKLSKITLIVLLTTIFAFGQNVAEIDTFLNKITTEQNFSGAVLVAKDGKILLEKGYGFADLKKTLPAKNDTKFYVASISKQFTAAAILKLEEQGKLSVNDLISKYLQDVPKDKADLKIHHLLSQSSGIDQNYAADGITECKKAVQAIFKKSLKHHAGEKFTYSNDNYSLLAIIVEIVSGKNYETFLRENFFAPLAMNQTGFWGEKRAEPIAELIEKPDKKAAKPNWGFRGATGISSTIGDLFKWQQALFSDQVLAKLSREKMFTPYFQMSRGMHGYGWFLSKTSGGTETIWTSGAEDFGHNGIIKTYADGTVVIVLSNAGELNGKLARNVAIEGVEAIIFK